MDQYKTIVEHLICESTQETYQDWVVKRAHEPVHMLTDLRKGIPIFPQHQFTINTYQEILAWLLSGEGNVRPLVLQKINIYNNLAHIHYSNLFPEEPLAPYEFIQHILDGNIKNHIAFTYRFGDLPSALTQYNGGVSDLIYQMRNTANILYANPSASTLVISGLNLPGYDLNMGTIKFADLLHFKTEPIPFMDRLLLYYKVLDCHDPELMKVDPVKDNLYEEFREHNIPKYYIDCIAYQSHGDITWDLSVNITLHALITLLIGSASNCLPRFLYSSVGIPYVRLCDIHKLEKVCFAINTVPIEQINLSDLKIF